MFNQIEAYTEIGKRVAKAINEQDQARAASEKDYFNRMFLCEAAGPDRTAARKAFDVAYTNTRKLVVREPGR